MKIKIKYDVKKHIVLQGNQIRNKFRKEDIGYVKLGTSIYGKLRYYFVPYKNQTFGYESLGRISSILHELIVKRKKR